MRLTHIDWRRMPAACTALSFLLATPGIASTTRFPMLSPPQSSPLAAGHAAMALKLTPDQFANFQEAIRALLKHDFAKSETLARQLTKAAPKAPGPWYLLGLALANLNRLDEAIPALDKASKLYTANAEPLVSKGEILMSQGRVAEARSAFEEAARRDPNDWRPADALGRIALKAGKSGDALAHLRLAVKHASPKTWTPRLDLARLLLSQGDPTGAAKLLAGATADDKAPDGALELLATADVAQGHVTEAKHLYDRLISRGTSLVAFLDRTRIAVGEGDLKTAQMLMDEAAKNFAPSPALFLMQGNVDGAGGNYAAALKAFKAGLAISPDDPALMHGASLADLRLGNLDAAATLAETLTGRPHASTADLMWLATIREQQKRFGEAIDLYRRVISADGKNWVAMNNLASLLTKNSPQKGLVLAKQAAALAPSGAEAVQDTLGWAQFRAGQTDAAIRTYRSMLAAHPGASLPSYRLGLILITTNRVVEGRSLLEKALKADPKSTYAEDARKALVHH